MGAEITQALARQGARVAINYHESQAAAEALAEAIRQAGGQAAALPGDAADPQAVRALVGAAAERLGGPDILVNNVGPYTDLPLEKLPLEQWDWIFNTNVRAAWVAAQAAYPAMQAAGWGRIVNIAAGSAFIRSHSVYGLAKAGLLALTEALAVEFAPAVTVNAIAPGLIDDPEVSEASRRHELDDTPLQRLVTGPEVAQMVCLLCSAAFDTVTGQAIVMNGGQTIQRGALP